MAVISVAVDFQYMGDAPGTESNNNASFLVNHIGGPEVGGKRRTCRLRLFTLTPIEGGKLRSWCSVDVRKGLLQEPQSVVHFARIEAVGLLRRQLASCPSRGFAACG